MIKSKRKNNKPKVFSSWVSTFQMNFHFRIFLILLLIEIAIAKYEFHPIIRGFVGDVLVIPLIYHFIKTFWKLTTKKLVFWILLFAFSVEMLQLLEFSKMFKIKSSILNIIIGTTFDTKDLAAYVIGGGLIYVERFLYNKLIV